MCNTMIYEQEENEGMRYLKIVRLRADSVFFAPVPSLANSLPDDRSVFMISARDGCCGNEDIFNVGGTEIMHAFLDRVQDIRRANFTKEFTAETYTRFWVAQVHGGRMRGLRGLRTHPWRWKSNKDGTEKPRETVIESVRGLHTPNLFWRTPQMARWQQWLLPALD